jgi:hypothetical protein
VTRAAVREGFEWFVDETATATVEAFRVARAFKQGGPANPVVERLLDSTGPLQRRVVSPEIKAHRRQVLGQVEVLLDYVESGEAIAAYREELLAADPYADTLRESLPAQERERIHDLLVARQRRLGEAVAPLVAAEHDGFWPAVTAALPRDRAVELVEERFPFTGLLREERDAFRMAVEVDPGDVLGGLAAALPSVEVEYTDEALRAMTRAERRVVAETKQEVNERYGRE